MFLLSITSMTIVTLIRLNVKSIKHQLSCYCDCLPSVIANQSILVIADNAHRYRVPFETVKNEDLTPLSIDPVIGTSTINYRPSADKFLLFISDLILFISFSIFLKDFFWGRKFLIGFELIIDAFFTFI